MHKIALYKKDKYYLSVGEDVVCLNLIVEITQESEPAKKYSAKIVQAQLDPAEDAFSVKILSFMSAPSVESFRAWLHGHILEELNPSLFTMFYTSDLQDANYTPAS